MNKPSTEAQATIRAASAQFVAYGLRGLLFREIGHQRAGITKEQTAQQAPGKNGAHIAPKESTRINAHQFSRTPERPRAPNGPPAPCRPCPLGAGHWLAD